jgi:hypothetical protein
MYLVFEEIILIYLLFFYILYRLILFLKIKNIYFWIMFLIYAASYNIFPFYFIQLILFGVYFFFIILLIKN